MSGVSLVIPCFNQAAFLPTAIESALAQSVPPAEIIVVDDGSWDDSAAQARRFGRRVRLVRQPNRGPAAARNAGIERTGCDLVAFLDGDDLWPPRSLAVRQELLARCGTDYVFGNVVQFRDADGPNVPASPPIAGRLVGAMLVRRSAFRRVGRFDPKLRSAEVIEWSARASASGLTGAAVRETVLLRRVHSANMMLTAPGTAQDRLAVLRANVARKRADAPR